MLTWDEKLAHSCMLRDTKPSKKIPEGMYLSAKLEYLLQIVTSSEAYGVEIYAIIINFSALKYLQPRLWYSK